MVRNHSLLAEFLRNIVIVNVHSEPLEKEPAGVKAFFFHSLFWCSALGKTSSFSGEQRMSSKAVNT